jgi:hypothetical protein
VVCSWTPFSSGPAEQISARLQQIPGVTAVGLGIIAMDGLAAKAPIFVEGVAAPTLPPIRFIWRSRQRDIPTSAPGR